MHRSKNKKIRAIPLVFIILAVLAVLCVSAQISFLYSPAFADGFNSSVGFAYRYLTAKLTDFIPFSFAEFLLFTSPLLLTVIIISLCRYASKCRVCLVRGICFFLCLPILVYCMFVAGLAPGYRGTGLDEKLSLDKREVSAGDLYHTQMIIVSELNNCAENVTFSPDGSSVMPFGYSEMSNKLCRAYDKVCGNYGFIDDFSSDVKPLVVSEYMTYTHLSGIYTFFTGEANINTNYPQYIVAYTAAHEMSHQRGISKEDEANFIAFLVCTSSDDPYIRYSGYLNMYSYVANALYSADQTLYSSAYNSLDPRVRGELKAYSEFFDKYRDSKASEVSDKLNEAYLESQGTAGVRSYGMVVDLAVAYYMK